VAHLASYAEGWVNWICSDHRTWKARIFVASQCGWFFGRNRT